MSGWLTSLGPEGTALALLVLGHVLGDFVFQTANMAQCKHRIRPLLAHGAVVLVVHIVTFLPLLTIRTGIIVVGIGIFHLLVDAASAQLRPRQGTALHLFIGDQLTHILALLLGWILIAPMAAMNAPVANALGGPERIPWAALTTGALYVSAFGFAHVGGNTLVRGILPPQGPQSETDDLEAGWLIGTLERWIIILLGVAGLWETVAIVVAAKSVARFEELKQRAFAEYFLIGTLASVLVALALVIGLSLLL